MRAWGWGVVLSCVATGAFAQTVDLRFSSYGFTLDFEDSIQVIDNARAERLVRLTPARPMSCEWEGDAALYCSFEDVAPLATRFRVDLAAGLRTVDGKAIGARRLNGETERPMLGGFINEWKQGRPVFRLTSNHKVSRDAVASVLRLEIDGQPASVDLAALPTAKWEGTRFDLVLPPARPNALVKLSVVPGLRSQDGPLLGKQDEQLALMRIDEPFEVRNAVCAGMEAPILARVVDGRFALDGCAPGESMRVQFSRALDAASRDAWVARWPAGMRLLSSGTEGIWRTRGDAAKGEPARAPGAWIEFTIDEANTSKVFDVAGLATEGGGTLVPPVAARVSTIAHRPAFTAPKAAVLLQDPGTPFLIARNTPATGFQVRTLDARAASESITAPAAGEAPVDIGSKIARAALGKGGFAEFAVSGEKTAAARMSVAAPDFDVFAVLAPGGVLVWANTWGEGAPVAGADVELVEPRADNAMQVIATARTAADGTAWVQLPRAFRFKRGDDRPAWFVRVQSGKRSGAARAVLPLEVGQYQDDLTTGEPLLRGWGVVDRPLYRAGDTVQWRLWRREFTGGAFRAPPAGQSVDLQLFDQDHNRTLFKWTATTDASGALAGATRLPSQLPDGEYCVAAGRANREGPCFFVGTFRAQDLWIRAKTLRRVLRDGDTLAFDVEAGYYSGGAASGASFERVQAGLVPASIGDVYEEYRAYAFNDEDRGDWLIKDADAMHLVADQEGRAHGSLPVAFLARGDTDAALPAFGRIPVTVEAKLSDRESTTSNTAEALYARYPRYVGLKVEPNWIDAGSPVKLEGVVVTAEGQAVPDARIDVEVYFGDDEAAPLHRCSLTAAQATDCTFPRTRSGVYRLVARSGDAAPVTLVRYVWTGWTRDDKQAPELELATPAGARGTPLRIAVRQSEPKAQVLLVARWGSAILGRQVATIDAANPVIDMPTSAEWPRKVAVTAYIRGGTKEDALPAGFRVPVRMRTAQTDVSFDKDPGGDAPVGVAFDRSRAAPGEKARLMLRNASAQTRSITLTVVDDALHALGAKYMDDMDPGAAWADTRGPSYFANTQGFDRWNDRAWRWNLKIMRDRCVMETGSDCGIRTTGNGSLNPIDVTSVESTTILTAEQVDSIPMPRDTTSVALLAPGTVLGRSSATELDAVDVIGGAMPAPPASPMVAAPRQVAEFGDAAAAPAPPQPNGKTGIGPPREDVRAALAQALASARVRSQFADTVVWRTDIELAPGESREVELTVPDNLTRWRAIAWSSDAGSDFAKAEATLEAGLPVEARLQAPVRVYPGDRTRVATNVRHSGEQAAQAVATLRVQGPQDPETHGAVLALEPRGQASFGVTLSPAAPGALLLTAAAATDAGRDAIAASVEVASPTIPAHKTQAGWIGASPLSLSLPALPEGARDAHLDVSVWRGNTALVQTWTTDLRDYPHRCWEQMLSRAIGAALALERNDVAWTDAKAVVQEALDNAAVFQKYDGSMQFFAQPSVFDRESDSNVALSAYTADAFDVLRQLGYQVPQDVDGSVRAFLADTARKKSADHDMDRAIAAASGTSAAETEGLRSRWDKLQLPGRIALARAMARQGSPATAETFAALLDAAPKHGGARSVAGDDGWWTPWLGSDLREQCSLIRLYDDFPQFAPKGAALELQAGLSDLYAGGATWADTQSSAICLIALRDAGGRQSAPIAVEARLGARSQRITLGAGEQRAAVGFDAPQGTLALQAIERPEAPVAYLAHLDYLEDARHAQSTAIGFALERYYTVLRNHQWVPIATAGPLRDGDWVRISLVVTTGKERHFVAITDDLPGGLRPMELSLAGVAGVDVQALGDLGDWDFDQRRLDPRKPKFYAEHLWPGRHEIHYFARVANSGDYLAAPALAELMYGETTRARTAADRIVIPDPAPGSAKAP